MRLSRLFILMKLGLKIQSDLVINLPSSCLVGITANNNCQKNLILFISKTPQNTIIETKFPIKIAQ
jgi:hypothetical protein